MAERSSSIAIIGLGVFGQFLCEALSETDAYVVAIDSEQSNVNSVDSWVDKSVVGDATDAKILEEAGVGSCDIAVVAIGENTEASIIASLNVQDLGVPRVYARSVTEVHRKILRKLGILEVINPEAREARRLAVELTRQGVERLAELEDGYSFVVMGVPEKMLGKPLRELDFRNRFGANIVGIRRPEETYDSEGGAMLFTRFVLPDAQTTFEQDDRILVIAREEDLREIMRGKR